MGATLFNRLGPWEFSEKAQSLIKLLGEFRFWTLSIMPTSIIRMMVIIIGHTY